ncbi:hypothetical protein Harreka1_21 [Olleya phage Harreka_1]|uniref:Uncharacterized protein n=1 Tax=Olleya phage Harreka_1 TaxID=2745673 RepID=A0A8E5E9G7_9CAUD|nr:hypothetical protein M1M26_gp21 [Olleya phage Harreka_1]QQV90428.1 hypothetical protein Harreka1_21 [Olleya phage Harreka_1]
MEQIESLMDKNIRKLETLIAKQTRTFTKEDKIRRGYLYTDKEGRRHPITGFPTITRII